VISSVFYIFFPDIHIFTRDFVAALKYRLVVGLISTDKKLATKQDRQTLQISDEKQCCHSSIA